jgi:hypothetical protein
MLHGLENLSHFGVRTERDTLNGKMYVIDCIDWFIKQVSSCEDQLSWVCKLRIHRASRFRATFRLARVALANALQRLR